MKQLVFGLVLTVAVLWVSTPVVAESCHDHTEAAPAAEAATETAKLAIPHVPVIDQDGRELDFYKDLVEGKVVAMNFIFTTCTTVCPPMGANFGKLRKLLDERTGSDVQLISVSIDPATDTPERMRAWGAKFGAGPGWTLVTGSKTDVTRLLKDLEVFSPDTNAHSPTVLLGDETTGTWTRANGLTPPAKLAEILDQLAPSRQQAAQLSPGESTPGESTPGESTPAEKYFTNVELVDQDGKPVRLYHDLLEGKIVVIDAIFTTCTGVCPVMSKALERVQERVGDRLGKDVNLISISIDPETDTPARLKEYAARWHAKPGWYFLTGKRENVDLALHKLGQIFEEKEAHNAVILVGNDRTGLWKKAFGLAAHEELLKIVESVLDDQG